MASAFVLKRATASSSLVSKLLNPVRSAAVAPSVTLTRSFNTDSEWNRSVGFDRRAPAFFPDTLRSLNQFAENTLQTASEGLEVCLRSLGGADEENDALCLTMNVPRLNKEDEPKNCSGEEGEVENDFFSGFVFCKKVRLSENRNLADHKRRLLAAKYEVKRKLFKALCTDPDLPSEVREKHRYELSKLPRNSSFTRVKNRCIFTGRPRSVYEFCRMSRIVFRELASRGALTGIKKASW